MVETLLQPASLGAAPKSPSRTAIPGTSSQRQYQAGRSPQQKPARLAQSNTMPLGESRLKPPASPMSVPRVAPVVRVQTEPLKSATRMAVSPVQRPKTGTVSPTSPRPLLRASFKVGPTLDSLVTARRPGSGSVVGGSGSSVVGGSGGSVVGGSVVGGPRLRTRANMSKVLAASPLGSSTPPSTQSLLARSPNHPGSKLGSSPPLPATSPVYFAPRSPNPEVRMLSPAPQKFFIPGAAPAASTVGVRPTGVLKHSASFESTSVPKPTSGNKNIAIVFTISWDKASDVSVRCLLDPGASVALLSKTFVKEHSVPKIKRDVPITVYDLAKTVVPDAGSACTQPLVLRHQDHFTKETFEIAALDERIDAVLPLQWIEKHELVGLRSGQVYFGSTFCMQNCTKHRLQKESAAPAAEKLSSPKLKKAALVPAKNLAPARPPIPPPKSPVPGKLRASSCTKITAPVKQTSQKPAAAQKKASKALPGKPGSPKLAVLGAAKTTTAESKISPPRKSSTPKPINKPANKPTDASAIKPTGPARRLISPNSLKALSSKNTPKKIVFHTPQEALVPATEIPDLIHDEDEYDSSASSEFEENPVPHTPDKHPNKSHQSEAPGVGHAHEGTAGAIGSEARIVEVVGEVH